MTTLPDPSRPFLPWAWPSLRLKRAIDLVLVLGTLPLWGLTIFALALLVGLGGGPVFFAQTRVGHQGRLFRMWKLRTMYRGAEGQMAQLLTDPALRSEWHRFGKLRNDPRVTPLGRILGRYSLDELPQFWNVLRGEMSLVGPRPMLPGEIAREYGALAHQVLSVRPGMTGPWQVQGGALGYAARRRLDLDYAATANARKDVALMLRTVAVIWRGGGV
jgi:exopolysaccharide production protein ExoY